MSRRHRKVWVVMGNDYPEAVFATEAAANAFIDTKPKPANMWERRIYWRAYEFEVREGGVDHVTA